MVEDPKFPISRAANGVDCAPCIKIKTQQFEVVPVAEINCENLDLIWPHLMMAIRNAQLIAIDLELSGLGDRAGKTHEFKDRYNNIKEATRTRSILSVGIATFQFNGIKRESKEIAYKCKVFDILSLEDRPFTVEPDALRFLSSHGFDFNRLISHGIRYSRKQQCTSQNPFKSLWEEILASGVAVTLHNGLIDLAFIHEHFYTPLPENADQFVANLTDWFGKRSPEEDYRALESTLWDSKHLAEQDEQFSHSYLDYVFRKSQRDNHRRLSLGMEPHLAIRFSSFPKLIRKSMTFSEINCTLKEDFVNGVIGDFKEEQLCTTYFRFGSCKRRIGCEKEHDVDFLLDIEEKKSQKKRGRGRKNQQKPRKLVDSEQGCSSEGCEDTGNGPEAAARQPTSAVGKKRKADATEDGLDPADLKKSPLEMSATNSPFQLQAEQHETSFSRRAIPKWKLSRGRHRAGMDSFTTGFSTLCFLRDSAFRNEGRLDTSLAGRIALPGKQFPLLLRKSQFVSQKSDHVLNWIRVEGRRRAFDDAKSSGMEDPGDQEQQDAE